MQHVRLLREKSDVSGCQVTLWEYIACDQGACCKHERDSDERNQAVRAHAQRKVRANRSPEKPAKHQRQRVVETEVVSEPVREQPKRCHK
jgi:hypothetical protein